MTRHQHWVDGQELPPAEGRYLPMLDPTTRAVGDEVAAGTAVDVEAAVAAASVAQRGWAHRSAAERSEVLELIAAAITRQADDLVEIERATTGKVDRQLRLEVGMSAAYFRYYAGVVRSHAGRTIDLGGDQHTYTRLEPYGVVAAITPWNLPLNQACRAIAPALAVGNAVIAKPAEATSLSTLHLARLATEVGLPRGALNVVTGTGLEAGTPLVKHRAVRRITFTGSVDTGRRLAVLAADRLVPMTLELGGKSPLIVFADADLDGAVAAAVAAVATNAGQVCAATTRLLVEESAHDEVVARVVKAVEQLHPAVDFGPMITEAQYLKVQEHFKRAAADGAQLLTGGRTYDDGVGAQGFYVQPTIYGRVDPSLTIAREEIFGPVLVTMAFTDESDALGQAEDSDYGLVAGVWSGDVARGLRLAERISAGQVNVNGGALGIETPFGGYKASGYGREKGLEALHDYAQVKTVSLALR